MNLAFRAITFDDNVNEGERRAELDLLAEVRGATHIREYACKQYAERKYNTKVIPRKLKGGDLVLKRTVSDTAANKLILNSDGPFRILEEIGQGVFKLEELNDREILRTWNLTKLRFYYK
ncbi:hypothetical protein SESBI_39595 [Sesbania bispinosa]|nr:hypothetical protein SESBI_39595 [Sesbania bispinosa]